VLAQILIPLMPTHIYVIGDILVAGVLLATAEIGIYHTITADDEHYHLASIMLNVTVYAVTLVLFLLVYHSRTRSLISATLIAVISTLLALESLSNTRQRLSDILLYAGMMGLLLGEITWALNYWRTASYTAGLLLLLIFHLTIGLSQQSLLGKLTHRVLLEYAVVALIGITFIIWAAP
ncbi:MAG: hypothetical protein J7M34_14780, partial [Anaerolineae bacterium]|nr:hypothetical protein [Anaerolineae bacterium]